MTLALLRRSIASASFANSRILSRFDGYSSNASKSIDKNEETTYQPLSPGNGVDSFTHHLGGMYRSPLFWHDQPQLDSREIKVVDSDTWRVSLGLAHVSKGIEHDSKLRSFGVEEVGDGIVDNPKSIEGSPDFDEIEDMRIHGSLFYKIDRNSREFEEYKFDFHGKKSSSSKNDKRESKKKENSICDSVPNGQKSLQGKEVQKASNKKGSLKDGSFVDEERLVRRIKENYIVCTPDEISGRCIGKKQRTPTFNQLTGPYHEPFCLDIYVSKGSIRACIVHRVTSKVVVVAHSISKDMKFDLPSTRSAATAAVVGKVLAQRALADDIHDVIFTPRKGDKLEGKLHIVLQSIIDNGINVKVKLKQRNPNRAIGKLTTNELVSP